MKGNENTARRSHPNLPPYGKGLTVSREVSPIQANPHFKDFVPLVLTNNNWAKFQGVATLNGSTELYPFKVDAFDADNNGGTQADRFVIKIWDYYADPDVDNPIYKASGDLGGGKVKIHN